MTFLLSTLATLAPFAAVWLLIYLCVGIAAALAVGVCCEWCAGPDPWEEKGRRGREEMAGVVVEEVREGGRE